MTTNHQGWQNLHTATEMNVKALSNALGVYLDWSFHTLVQKQATRAIAVPPRPQGAIADLTPEPRATPDLAPDLTPDPAPNPDPEPEGPGAIVEGPMDPPLDLETPGEIVAIAAPLESNYGPGAVTGEAGAEEDAAGADPEPDPDLGAGAAGILGAGVAIGAGEGEGEGTEPPLTDGGDAAAEGVAPDPEAPGDRAGDGGTGGNT